MKIFSLSLSFEIRSNALLLLNKLQSSGRWDVQEKPALAPAMHVFLLFPSAERKGLRQLQREPWGCPCLPPLAKLGLCSYCTRLSFTFRWLERVNVTHCRVFLRSGTKDCYHQMQMSWHEEAMRERSTGYQ